MIRHEAVSLKRHAVVREEFGEHCQVKLAVLVTMEDLFLVVSALGDVVGESGCDNAIDAWH